MTVIDFPADTPKVEKISPSVMRALRAVERGEVYRESSARSSKMVGPMGHRADPVLALRLGQADRGWRAVGGYGRPLSASPHRCRQAGTGDRPLPRVIAVTLQKGDQH
jgi:hypothetical protein